MQHIASSLLKFYLYSNFHIGLCAGLFAIQYSNAFEVHESFSIPIYFGFICSSTIALYCIHRFIGYQRLYKQGNISGRYVDIERLIPIYPFIILVSGSCSLYFLWILGVHYLSIIALPIILSVLYVAPILPGARRLRDLDFIKIFVIAITWVWFATWYLNIESDLHFLIIVLESVFFMLGITLPFDIRDKEIDNNDSVKTLVTRFGIKTGIISSVILLLSSLSLTYIICTLLQLSSHVYVSYGILHIALILVISKYSSYKNDLLLTGFIDGGILIKGFLGILLISQI